MTPDFSPVFLSSCEMQLVLYFTGMMDDCSDVLTMCDRIGRSSLIISLPSHVGAGSRLHDLGVTSMTIFLISSGVGRANEDRFDVQQLLISTCSQFFL